MVVPVLAHRVLDAYLLQLLLKPVHVGFGKSQEHGLVQGSHLTSTRRHLAQRLVIVVNFNQR